MLRPEYASSSQAQKRKIVEDMRSRRKDLEFWENDFYAGLQPTKFGRGVMSPEFIDRDDVKSVTILTFSSSDKLNENKAKFIAKFFNHPKIKMVPVNGFGRNSRVKKSDVMKEIGGNWDVFVDDMLYNIRDFAENFKDIKGKKFFSPDLGYNHMPQELLDIIESKGASYFRFNVL